MFYGYFLFCNGLCLGKQIDLAWVNMLAMPSLDVNECVNFEHKLERRRNNDCHRMAIYSAEIAFQTVFLLHTDQRL